MEETGQGVASIAIVSNRKQYTHDNLIPSFSCAPSANYFLLLAVFFFVTDLDFGLTVAFLADFFVPNTESQFFENSGVGAVRTIGPDIVG